MFDCKIVDLDVKPQPKQTNNYFSDYNSSPPLQTLNKWSSLDSLLVPSASSVP